MEHGHSDNPNYTRGYAFRVGDQYGGEWHLPDDGDWVVTNSRGQRVLVSDADFKALYKDGP
jgi:hypothetical protein